MMKFSTLRAAIVLFVFVGAVPTVSAQIGISASDGGFENGTSTFVANGWSTALPAATRLWRVGTAAGSVPTGTKAAYVGAAANFNGANAAQVGHFWRDVVVPAGATNVTLGFFLRMPATDNGNDRIRVYTTTTANTPVSGTTPGAGYTQRFQNTASEYTGFNAIGPIDLTALAGTTIRLVFTNVSNAANPNVPIAIDNVTLNWDPPCAAPTTGGYTVCQNGSVPGGSGLTSSACASGTVPFTALYNFPSAPIISEGETYTLRSTLTVPALPPGSVVTSVYLVFTNTVATAPSYLSELLLDFTGLIVATEIPLSNTNASGTVAAATFQVTGSLVAFGTGGSIALSTREDFDDAVPSPDASIGGAQLQVNYTMPSPVWYATATGGTALGGGTVFNPVAVGAVNTAVPGSTTFYAQCMPTTCTGTLRTPAVFTVNPTATANAGGPYTTCGTTAVNISATASGAGSWSGGTGSFGNASNVSTTYTPAIGEIGTTFNLTWTTNDPDGAGPCAAVLSNASLTVNTPATANANGPYSACGTAPVSISATTNGTGTWSGGAGSFGTATNASTTYTPDISEVGTTFDLTWTTSDPDGAGPCAALPSNASLTVVAAPTTATVGGPQTICENATTVGLGGNIPGSGTGAWSIVSGGTGAFTPDNLDPNATFTHAAGSGPVVLRWTISTAAPCAPSTADVSITISQNPTASVAGPPQSICNQPGSATMAANTPTDGTGAWSQVSGPISATITTPGSPTTTITGMTTPGNYVFRWTISNAPCTADDDDVTVTTSVCTYYSRATGNVSDPIWSDTPTGTAGAATFNSSTSMVVQLNDQVINTTNTQVNDLTIDAGGELIVTGGTIFTTNGDAVAVNGDLTCDDNSIMLLNSAVASTATFATTTSFWDLAVDADVSCTVTGNIEIRGSLDLFDGVFDCTGNQVTLRSTATYTGRLGPVDPGASYVGNMKVQRRIPAGATNWRLLGSPIAGRVVEDWDDDFITAGYPGSDYPNFDDPVGSGISWPSVRYYDETEASAVDSVGLHGVANTNVSLAQGQGFAVWCGDNLGGTAAFMIDVQDGAPHIANTPITLPMSWTNVPTSADGWNLVSNPLPSPINFETMNLGADVDEVVTFYDPADGNSATYDRVSNLSNNGGTNVIQSSQGFFLKAHGPAVTTTVSESDKVNTNGGGIFGLGGQVPAHLRLSISSDVNTFSDESVVYFTAGTPDLDERDALKYVFAHPAAPQIATLAGGEQIAINAYGSIDGAISIPLRVNVGVTGTYVISGVEVGGLDLNCLSIEDLEMGTIASLEDGAAYSFDMAANADPSVPRFVLHANNGPQASFTADNTTVIVGQTVQFTATTTTGNYTWSFGDGAESTEQNPAHAYTMAGTYTVVLTVDDGLCSSTANMEVTVELSTGVTNTENTATHVWANRDWIIVDHNYQSDEPLFIEVLDATGRLQVQRKVAAFPGRVTLPADELSTGVWFVRLTQGETQESFRVPLLR